MQSDVQIPRTWIQNRLFYALNTEKNRLKNAKQTHFRHAKMLEVQKYFFITSNKIGFYLILAEVPGVAPIIFFFKNLKNNFKSFYYRGTRGFPKRNSVYSIQPFGQL